MILRTAREADAAAVRDIYAPYVAGTAVSFETAPPDLRETEDRIRVIGARYPFLIAEIEGRVAGYAHASRHMERAAYQWNAALSVYVHGDFQARGIGTALAGSLMELLRLQNFRNAYGYVTLPNPGSVRLCGRLGFRSAGILRNTGYKCGRWHDVEYFEKRIGEHGKDPLPPVDMERADPDAVRRILERGNFRADCC
jgi:phosphinothricin acetyltransferase